jgi:hypothetical protein
MIDPFKRSPGLLSLFAGLPFIWFAVSRTAAEIGPPPAPAATPPTATAPGTRPPAPAASVSTVTTAALGPSGVCLARFLDPIYAMAGVPAPKVDTAASIPDWLDRVSEASEALRQSFNATITDSLIATLPDPIDSGLTYSFETMLQAVRRGIEQASPDPYYRDRSWLPWDDRDIEAAKQKEVEGCRSTLPGVMLFRGGRPESSKSLALLLVGESPTTGLRQLAMKNALDVRERFVAPRKPGVLPKGARNVRIVGPSFSASAQSLRLALRNWAQANGQLDLTYQVLSGTASGDKVPSWLGKTGSPLTEHSTISYRSTTVPDAIIECSYLRFLHRQLNVDEEQGSTPQALEGVATLSEAGTEFGATATATSTCPWRASSSFHFPFHVSALRDAYEKLDKAVPTSKDAAITRAISLDASLREARPPLDVEGNPSQKASTAEDLALGNVLGFISTRHIRHLAIRATDVGDAIFLARRVRDIAPDVRLAFFDSDALLVHPTFRRELVGSLVITPYPFLGVTELASPSESTAVLDGFVNGNAQGVFNAAVLQQHDSAAIGRLNGYTKGATSPLPLWVATIGRGALVPNKVTPTADCDEVLYGTNKAGDPTLNKLCSTKGEARHDAWQTFNDDHSQPLRLERTARLPYTWDLLFAILCFAFGIDRALQNRQAQKLALVGFPSSVVANAHPKLDQSLDLAIGRSKWRLYAVIRSFLFALAFTYMSSVYSLGILARSDARQVWSDTSLCLGMAAVAVVLVLSVGFAMASIGRFFHDFSDFGRCVGASLVPKRPADLADAVRESKPTGPDAVSRRSSGAPPPRSLRFGERLSLTFGVLQPEGKVFTARVSFAQLRLLAWLSMFVAAGFSGLLVWDVLASAEIRCVMLCGKAETASSLSRLTLFALRNANMTSGVSPSTPALLIMLCVYVWAVGRMARLQLAHSMSRFSPPDGETDLVSTPIRLVLHPSYAEKGARSDAGFTQVERDVLNAIWRPITGRYYVIAAISLAFFPIVLFALKPLSTLCGRLGTLFLGSGLALCVYLIGITVIQLLQYWLSLKKLLKRVLEHPLGPAFRTVPDFARDSVDHQVSRLPDEALRWSACAQQFDELMRSVSAISSVEGLETTQEPLVRQDENEQDIAARLMILRQEALVGGQSASSPELHPAAARADAEAALGCEVILAASLVTALLETPWRRHAALLEERPKQQTAPSRISGQLEVSWLAAAGDDWTPPHGLPIRTSTENRTAAWRAPRAVGTLTASSEAPPAPAPSDRVHRGALDGQDDAPVDALSPGSNAFSRAEMKWLRQAQTFVATVVTLLIHRHVRQFRYFVQVTTACSLLLLLAVANYPFEPYRLLLTIMWIVMGTVVGSGLWIFFQLDRNTLISHISGSDPQALTVDGALFLRVFAWVIVPLLSVAAAQYPDVADSLFKVLTPFEHALR